MLSVSGDNESRELSARLDDYMHRIKDIKAGGAHLETVNFNRSAAAMEQEIRNLRSMYDKEIMKLRSDIQKKSSDIAKGELVHGKLEKSSTDIRERMGVQLEENSKLDDSVLELKSAIVQKENDIAELNVKHNQLETNEDKRCTSASQLNKALKENSNLKARLEQESEANKKLEDTIHQLEHMTNFNKEVAETQQVDLQDRLGAASGAIVNLEGKVRHITRPEQDQHVAEMIAAIKDTSERELHRYKVEAEATFTRNISSLKCQMERDRQMQASVTTENRRIMDCIEELNTKIRNMQGELTHLDHAKASAEENLAMERERVVRQTQELKSKLEENQANLLDTMKELNEVKCQNLPLKAEAEAMKAFIDEEKDRMCMEMRREPTEKYQPTPYYQISSAQPDQSSRPYQTSSAQPHQALRSYQPSPAQHEDRRYHVTTTAETETRPAYTPVNPATPVPLEPGSFIPATIAEGFPIAAPSVIPGMPHGADAMPGYEMISTPLQKSSRGTTPHYPRVKSAPASTSRHISRQRNMTNEQLGQGRSYFDQLFKDKSNYPRVYSAGTAKYVGMDAEAPPKSSLGIITIHEVSSDGRFVMLHNTAAVTDKEIGGYSIRQNVSGVPVTEFRFPDRMAFRAGTFITVFSGLCSGQLHQPPAQFVRLEPERWGTGPECTTILCNQKGKAVAWVNAPHKHSTQSLNDLANDADGPQSFTHKLPLQRHSHAGTEDGSPLNPTHPLYLKRLRDCIGNHVEISKLPDINKHKQMTTCSQRPNRPFTAGPSTTSIRERLPHSATGIRMGSAPMKKFVTSS